MLSAPPLQLDPDSRCWAGHYYWPSRCAVLSAQVEKASGGDQEQNNYVYPLPGGSPCHCPGNGQGGLRYLDLTWLSSVLQQPWSCLNLPTRPLLRLPLMPPGSYRADDRYCRNGHGSRGGHSPGGAASGSGWLWAGSPGGDNPNFIGNGVRFYLPRAEQGGE